MTTQINIFKVQTHVQIQPENECIDVTVSNDNFRLSYAGTPKTC